MFLHSGSLLSSPVSSFPSVCGPTVACVGLCVPPEFLSKGQWFGRICVASLWWGRACWLWLRPSLFLVPHSHRLHVWWGGGFKI